MLFPPPRSKKVVLLWSPPCDLKRLLRWFDRHVFLEPNCFGLFTRSKSAADSPKRKTTPCVVSAVPLIWSVILGDVSAPLLGWLPRKRLIAAVFRHWEAVESEWQQRERRRSSSYTWWFHLFKFKSQRKRIKILNQNLLGVMSSIIRSFRANYYILYIYTHC